MIVLKSTHDRKVSKLESQRDAAERAATRLSLGWEQEVRKMSLEKREHERTEQFLSSCEKAIAIGEESKEEADSRAEKYKQEMKHMQKRLENQRKQIQSLQDKVDNLVSNADSQRQTHQSILTQLADAQRQLQDARSVSYVATTHRNNVLAARRYTNLDDALNEAGVWEEDSGIGPKIRVFALIGDTVIADVTDSDKWDETLPISRKESTMHLEHQEVANRFLEDIHIALTGH